MHKRNISLSALSLAMLLAGVFEFWPRLTHSDTLGTFYLPSALLMMLLSWGSHSPPPYAGWSSFVVYTISYWGLAFVCYAIILEIWVLWRILHHLDDGMKSLVAGQPDPDEALENLGRVISEGEVRRRSHFFLRNINVIDLNEDGRLIAARAVAEAGDERLVKGLLKRLQAKATAEMGPEKGAAFMDELKREARSLVARNPSSKRKDRDSAGGTTGEASAS